MIANRRDLPAPLDEREVALLDKIEQAGSVGYVLEDPNDLIVVYSLFARRLVCEREGVPWCYMPSRFR